MEKKEKMDSPVPPSRKLSSLGGTGGPGNDGRWRILRLVPENDGVGVFSGSVSAKASNLRQDRQHKWLLSLDGRGWERVKMVEVEMFLV
jgi:hypothetical protein